MMLANFWNLKTLSCNFPSPLVVLAGVYPAFGPVVFLAPGSPNPCDALSS